MSSVGKVLKTQRYYLDRAIYMRRLAKEAVTGKLRESCLKSAEQFEMLARSANDEELRRSQRSAERDGRQRGPNQVTQTR